MSDASGAGKSAPHVTIVILNWNQRDLTLDCLASLHEQSYERCAIVLVDNGSRDDSVAAIRKAFPQVVILENGDNLGFAEGNNVGIRHALQSPTDYVLLLNNDTRVDPHMLSELMAVMEADPSVGIAGPKMLYFDRPDVIWCAGNRIDWRRGESIRLGAEQPDRGLDDSPQEMDFITGCAICLRRSVIEQIGLLDSRFFIYYEETDLCLRAHAVGWRILYVPRARLWHKVSAAMGTTTPATDYYMSRNVLLFLVKNRKGFARLASLVSAAGRNLLTVAAYSVKSHHGQRLPNRDARLMSLRDALLGRWGKMGADVMAVCAKRSHST